MLADKAMCAGRRSLRTQEQVSRLLAVPPGAAAPVRFFRTPRIIVFQNTIDLI
jgi:hypothetical protein